MIRGLCLSVTKTIIDRQSIWRHIQVIGSVINALHLACWVRISAWEKVTSDFRLEGDVVSHRFPRSQIKIKAQHGVMAASAGNVNH